MRHRGTDVAIVACLFLGGSVLSMIPLSLLTSLLSPVHIPAWRTGAVVAVALVVGPAMLFLARSLERGRAWARPVGIAVLATFTVAIGLFAFMVATSEDAGDGAGYAVLFGLVVGGFTLAGCIGLATRGSAEDFPSLSDYPS
jgi:heme/copper-type cytochrome/quinol oxidase subunit 4